MHEPTADPPAARWLSAREAMLLFVLAAIQFTHIVDFVIVMPLGPVYIREMGLSLDQFGHIVAAYTLAAGVAAIAASQWLDRFGRKAALLTLFAGFAAGTLLCAVAPNYWTLLAARTVAGACGGVAAAVVYAIIGDVFHDARRGMATGVIMSAFSVASAAGVPIGLVLADRLDWHAPFAVLGGFAVLVLALAAVVLPPLRGHIGSGPPRVIGFAGLFSLMADTNHRRAFALSAALSVSSFVVVPYIPTFLRYNVGLTQGHIGWMYVAGGVTTLVTLTWIGRLADRHGKLRVFRLMAVATLVAILALTNLPAGAGAVVALAVTTVMMIASSGRMVPAMALITGTAVPAERAGFLSLNTAVQHFSCGLAAAFGGRLLGKADAAGPITGYALAGLASGAASLASLYLAGRLRLAPGGELAPDSPEIVAAETEVEVEVAAS
jgi:predicted MFS family arabinose efflux permease